MAISLPVDVPRFMVHSGSVPSDVNPRIPVIYYNLIIIKKENLNNTFFI